MMALKKRKVMDSMAKERLKTMHAAAAEELG